MSEELDIITREHLQHAVGLCLEVDTKALGSGSIV